MIRFAFTSLLFILLSFSLLACSGCGGSSGRYYQSGGASWYGPGFDGKQTASGEKFDEDDLTAAHRSLPFGTKVRVTNMANGKSVVVEINDRGPFKQGRVIDLSKKAFGKIAERDLGVVSVRIEVLD